MIELLNFLHLTMYIWIDKDLYISNIKHQFFVSTSIHLAVFKMGIG